ncbi:penicillin-binding protein 2 [Lentimicrobium sp.]|jgi:penicillin-binding protein 2|uniref:penicillin-binding protein 2 n=1 Tax=Lentimicrobium sp. TaxID=2034841 RepID=UPI0025D385D4|nr:penicillin-binding protein 2 [Lentimicrobium sp.]MCO5256179.1 penicillin-binding protein 2 [Lentimicrobium sp.]MCO5262031.1 penicillin-binding protein 2 [Lentimicrobium sp.]HOP12666.1 penicillin-binding protein 2 [Lentimicrobium sp.]HPF64219.1 penicillin-binding protein 2 [Lentimicrobium sp.]HPJ61319.1 penicillin-binding protein 2 [Lentimicrobium sp.]
MANKSLASRKQTVIAIFVATGIIFLGRLFYLQIIDDSYELSANNNVLRYVTQYPARGLIYDRNGKLLVYNEAVYDLMVLPRQVKDIDTLEFCRLLDITPEGFVQRMKKAKDYSRFKPSLFEKQISKETYGYLEEKMYRFPGFFVQPRTLRKYPDPMGAHLLGYVGEVNQSIIDKDTYYKSGDYIGISGIEKSYEENLRGKKGIKIRMVDVHNREVGSFQNGLYDTLAVMGNDLYLTIDAELQQYGEQLMQGKMGSVVAIEPSSGEILAFLSSPTYDPNLLVGRVRGKNFSELSKDPVKPLLNRAMMGQYPPGSTFKMVNDLVGLQEGVLDTHTHYTCQGPGSSPIRCTHNHQSPLDVYVAIQQSCNPFHWQVYRSILNNPRRKNVKENYTAWRNHVMSMGFGHKLGTDMQFELSGNVPPAEKFDAIYGKGRWNAMTVRSLSIGQGEILVTPLQLANSAAVMANRGHYIVPHVVKSIGTDKSVKDKFKKVTSTIEPAYFEIAVEGMRQVATMGTAKWYQIEDITMCGKTGTAENPHGEDHSLFMAFAPADNPVIAIAVIVENSGFGSTWALPIASLMIEKYIKREVSRKEVEEKMINGKLY